MDKEFAIVFKLSVQVSECEWDVINISLKATQDTTMGEIEKEFRKRIPVGAMYVQVSELQNIESEDK